MARMVVEEINDALYRRLKLKAAQEGTSVKALIIEAIERIVAGGKK